VSAARLAASLVLLTACRASPHEQIDKLSQTQRSWEETTRLTTELWQRGAVPAEYARQTLDAARQELDKARRSVEQLSQ
jgi:exonuclease VII small subunit